MSELLLDLIASLLIVTLAFRLIQLGRLTREGKILRRRLDAWSGEGDVVDEELEDEVALAVMTLSDRLGDPSRPALEPHEAIDVIDSKLCDYHTELHRLDRHRVRRTRQVQRARTLNDELRGWDTAMEARTADVEARVAIMEADRVQAGPTVTHWSPPGRRGGGEISR